MFRSARGLVKGEMSKLSTMIPTSTMLTIPSLFTSPAFTIGVSVGELVGEEVGLSVGEDVGEALAVAVGEADAVAVGVAVLVHQPSSGSGNWQGGKASRQTGLGIQTEALFCGLKFKFVTPQIKSGRAMVSPIMIPTPSKRLVDIGRYLNCCTTFINKSIILIVSKRKALITGITGQDGSYLAPFLLKKGYEVSGIVRKTSHEEYANIGKIQDDLTLYQGDLLDPISLREIIQKVEPDEVYNLASQSHPSESFKQPIHTAEITAIGAHRVLDATLDVNPKTKFYQASSSEMYGWVREIPQTEETPFNPANPYAVAKLYAFAMTKIYRKSYNMFAVNGILFNHESPRRHLGFVTQKVTYAAACAKLGIKNSHHLNEEGEQIVKNGKVSLGNLEAKRDWGFAGDYVEGMYLIMQADKPDDFILATGETHSIKELCEEAFDYVNLNWEDHVTIDKRFIRPTETGPLIGDPAKAKKILGWTAKTSFKELVKMMVEAHLARLK